MSRSSSASVEVNRDLLIGNHAALIGNRNAVAGISETLASNHAYPENNAAVMPANHDLLIRIAAKPGVI